MPGHIQRWFRGVVKLVLCASVFTFYPLSGHADFVHLDYFGASIDVGGYVEDGDGNFSVIQPCPCSPDRSISNTLGGATMEASASVELTVQPDIDAARFFRVTNELSALAEVNEELGGAAAAFAFLDFLIVSFEVTSENTRYLGTTPLTDLSGNTISSGSFIGPGFYDFDSSNAPPGFISNLSVGLFGENFVQAGESILRTQTNQLDFRFVQVPAPAALPLLGLAVLLMMVMRRREWAPYSPDPIN